MDDAALMDNGLSLMDDGSLMMDDGLPRTSYVSLMKFLAGAFDFQENTPENKLCVSDCVPSRGFCFLRTDVQRFL